MKSEFQEQITNIVLNWVENNYYPERYREYSIDISYHFSRGRPDIVIDEWFDKGKQFHKPISTIIEIKSCYMDLTSGYGLNLFGDYNFICYRRDWLSDAEIDSYMKEHHRLIYAKGYGLIEVLDNGTPVAKRSAPNCSSEHFGYLFARNIGVIGSD